MGGFFFAQDCITAADNAQMMHDTEYAAKLAGSKGGQKPLDQLDQLDRTVCHKDFVRKYSPELVFDTLYTTDWSANFA